VPRAPYTPTEKDRTYVETMVASGVPQVDIALVLGITDKTLRKHFQRELKTGSIRANATVAARLFKMTESIPAAAMFWLKTRAGWRETNRVELDDVSKLTDEELKARVIAIESSREKSI